jgi:hypothetical protein
MAKSPLHAAFLSIERLMGPMAKAPGPLAHGYAKTWKHVVRNNKNINVATGNH